MLVFRGGKRHRTALPSLVSEVAGVFVCLSVHLTNIYCPPTSTGGASGKEPTC